MASRFCTKCGAERRADADFCANCGADFRLQDTPQPPPTDGQADQSSFAVAPSPPATEPASIPTGLKPPRSRVPLAFAVVGLAVVLVGAAALGYLVLFAGGSTTATVVFATSPGGSISPSGTYTYKIGSTVAVTVTPPSPDWTAGLLVDDTAVSLTNGTTYQLPVDGNHQLQATFAQVAPEVHQLDPASNALLTDMSADDTQVTFSGSTPQLSSLKVGDILVNAPATGSDKPLMVRVQSITQQGDGVVLVTTPASLAEVFANLSLSLSLPLTQPLPQADSAYQRRPIGPLLA